MAGQHRLHYRWSQLEADLAGVNVGSALRPLPAPDRQLRLQRGRRYAEWPRREAGGARGEPARFFCCRHKYETDEYQTFDKNGCLKLTEVEVHFLSQHMNRHSCREWGLVYLGIGNGDRFRWLRDTFFPDLAVVAYDPCHSFHEVEQARIRKQVESWTEDGTRFSMILHSFQDTEAESATVERLLSGRKVLLISDIRGHAFLDDGYSFDKDYDNDLQVRAIRRLRPLWSMVKFAVPDLEPQFYKYLPGVPLKQVFCYNGSPELRLLIEGVPEKMVPYNAWEIFDKMMTHHEQERGQVYENRYPCKTQILDRCFDCSVLCDTVGRYARESGLDVEATLDKVLRFHIYSPETSHCWWSKEMWDTVKSPAERGNVWWDTVYALKHGRLMTAVAVLENSGECAADWQEIADDIEADQPVLAARLRTGLLPGPASKLDLIRELGSLSQPFTLVRTDLNRLRDGYNWDGLNRQGACKSAAVEVSQHRAGLGEGKRPLEPADDEGTNGKAARRSQDKLGEGDGAVGASLACNAHTPGGK